MWRVAVGVLRPVERSETNHYLDHKWHLQGFLVMFAGGKKISYLCSLHLQGAGDAWLRPHQHDWRLDIQRDCWEILKPHGSVTSQWSFSIVCCHIPSCDWICGARYQGHWFGSLLIGCTCRCTLHALQFNLVIWSNMMWKLKLSLLCITCHYQYGRMIV